jgi:hypothetical protein
MDHHNPLPDVPSNTQNSQQQQQQPVVPSATDSLSLPQSITAPPQAHAPDSRYPERVPSNASDHSAVSEGASASGPEGQPVRRREQCHAWPTPDESKEDDRLAWPRLAYPAG